MKPYILIVYNKVKMLIKKLGCKGLYIKGILMMDYQTKIVLKSTSAVEFGDRVISDGRVVIIVDENARLTIGDKVYFNEDVMISCKNNIVIGTGCKFGPNVKIFDNNHKFDSEKGVSNEHSSASIVIGDNCWIGSNVVILKGTQIGKNCVIGAGCVITGIIPDSSIVTQGRDLRIEAIR